MRLAALFSGGKDSAFAAFLAREAQHDLVCFVTLVSENPDSFLFHTPAVSLTARQAGAAGVPLVSQPTAGVEEAELDDLRAALRRAREEHRVEGVVTGAVGSVYQATRIQQVCAELGLTVFNPLWQLPQLALLEELLANGFDCVVSAVAAHPLDASWVGRRIDERFIGEVRGLQERFGINPAGEGGEFETLVLRCPLFSVEEPRYRVEGSGNAFRMVLG